MITPEQHLPSGWAFCSVDDIGELIRGITYKKEQSSKSPGPSLMPILRANNINGGLNFDDLVYVPRSIVEEDQSIKQGDIVFAMSSGSLHLVGKSAQAQTDWDGSCGAFCAILRIEHPVFSKFLAFLFQSNAFRRKISEIAKGSNINNLKREHILEHQLALPPLAEQRRIVAKIEELFSELDQGIENLKLAQTQLTVYRQALLKHAFEGKLTAAWRKKQSATETGEQLLARILSERRQNWQGRGKYKEPAAPDTKKLAALPKGWAWATIDQMLTEPLCNGISIKGSDSPPGVRALRLSAMADSGFDYSDARYLPLSESDVDDLWIQEGDFFMSRGNGSLHLVGRGTSAQPPPHPTIFPDTMIRLRFAPAIRSTGWVRTLWLSRLIRSQIEAKVKTTAGIYKIAQPQVEAMVIPLPPLDEQAQIVAEVGQVLSVCSVLESDIETNLQKAEALRQSILKKAFAGELVPQDLADEPAAVLLARLRAEREAAAATKIAAKKPATRRKKA